MTPERRMQIAFELSDMADQLCIDGIRERHPDYDSRQIFLARARLLLGDDLYRAAYPGEAELEP